VTVEVDAGLVLSWQGSLDRDYADLGFCRGTGALTNWHIVDEPITFTNESTGTVPLSFQWSFGDGATSTATHPVHAYTATGTFAITLTVTDACAKEEQAATTIVVVRPGWMINLPLIWWGRAERRYRCCIRAISHFNTVVVTRS
jgi:hypothetical protein